MRTPVLALERRHVADLRAAEGVDALVVVADGERARSPSRAGRRTSSARRTAACWCPGTRRPGCAGSAAGSARAARGCRASARRCAASARRSRPRPRAGTARRRPRRPATRTRLCSSRTSMSLARRPSSFAAAIAHVTCLGTWRSSSRFIAFITRFTAESWSAESRIWKPCGSAASFQCARRNRLHRPWNVPTHMPRTGIAQHRVEPGQHLLRRLVGEGHGEHAAGRELAGLDQPGDAGGEDAGLAGAGAGEDQGRLGRQGDGGELFGVQAFEQPRRRRGSGRASPYCPRRVCPSRPQRRVGARPRIMSPARNACSEVSGRPTAMSVECRHGRSGRERPFASARKAASHGNLRLRQHPAAAAQVPRGEPLRVRPVAGVRRRAASPCRWCRRT